MTKLQQYNRVYKESFSLSDDQINDSLTYQSVPGWDSVGHMHMIASLEEAFGIIMDTEDIIEYSSYEKGKIILAKYGVVLAEMV